MRTGFSVTGHVDTVWIEGRKPLFILPKCSSCCRIIGNFAGSAGAVLMFDAAVTFATMVPTGVPAASQANTHMVGHWCRKYLPEADNTHETAAQIGLDHSTILNLSQQLSPGSGAPTASSRPLCCHDEANCCINSILGVLTCR